VQFLFTWDTGQFLKKRCLVGNDVENWGRRVVNLGNLEKNNKKDGGSKRADEKVRGFYNRSSSTLRRDQEKKGGREKDRLKDRERTLGGKRGRYQRRTRGQPPPAGIIKRTLMGRNNCRPALNMDITSSGRARGNKSCLRRGEVKGHTLFTKLGHTTY